MSRPILCLDFDGVLHSYKSGWKGAAIIPDPPVPGMVDFLRRVVKDFDVHIFSSRSHQEGGISAMRSWLWCAIEDEYGPTKEANALFDVLKFPVEKPAAKVTLDDRAITFNGIWPDISTLLNFKPWHERGRKS
jgi:hypothetical protein